MQPAGCEQRPSRDDVAKKELLVHLRGKINWKLLQLHL